MEAHFIIGPEAGDDGPHLLYRPLFEPPLLEYPSQQALLAAIQLKGELQDGVLAWMAPARQSIYANGGFRQPHIRYFLQGDEFTPYSVPEPAQLSRKISDTDPARQVFAATARALVSLADRQSVSNTERRWASLKQAGWLLFNSLMPLVSGPLMLGGWLLQVVDSLRNDLPALRSDDEQARNAAVLDVLVNLMAIVAHQARPHDGLAPLALEHPVFASLAQPASGQMLAHSQPPAIFEAPASWANARDTLSAELQARIDTFALQTASNAWPSAVVRGQLFRVRIEQDRARVLSAEGAREGPWLKRLGNGQWDFDLQLRLRGGSDRPEPPPAYPEVLERDYQQAGLDRAKAQRAMEIARALVDKPEGELAPQHRSRAWHSYLHALKDKLSAAQRELSLLKRLREMAPRRRYEEELCQVLESIILSAQLLDAHNRTQVGDIHKRLLPLLEHETDERYAPTELNQGMRELVENYDSSIHWRTLEQRHLDELKGVPRLGRDKARALASIPARPSVLDLQALQVTTLWNVAIYVPGDVLDDDFFASLSETIDRARWASCSQANMDQLSSTEAERIELLDSIDHVYAQTDDRIEFWRAMTPDNFNLDYLGRLQGLLATLHRKVEQDLGELLQAPSEPTPRTVQTATSERRRKIIRTRNRDIYVAQLSASNAELRDSAGQVIGSFIEAEDGVWDTAPRPRTPRPDPELGALLKQADGLLADVDRAIASVEKMVGHANDPASLQALLEAQARSRIWAADAIQRKLRGLDSARLAAVQQANARVKESALRTAAARLDAAGLDARIRGSRNKVLNQDDIAFLQRHNEVRIRRRGERVALRTDFLQVYEVTDVHTGKPLCFAHFHYGRRHSADDHFTAAHLKTPEQEYLGRQAQAEVEAQAFARMRLGQTGRVQQTLDIRRSAIQLAMARRLFFSVD